MSSPRRRIETDVMKLYVKSLTTRLMSDYEVTLVNDNMQGNFTLFKIEFYVNFSGPEDSNLHS